MPDDVQLDLMEKDIVIEQLRTQVKQLRSRIAVLEEEQAADTAPLQGLLNQLGELKVRKYGVCGRPPTAKARNYVSRR